MADEQPRHWWQVKRIQGIAIMAAGFACLLNPATAPYAGTVIAVGAGWTGVGAAAKYKRTKLTNNQ